MDSKIVRTLFTKGTWSIVELLKASNRSSRTAYSTIQGLEDIGVVNFFKGQIRLLNSPSRFALQELVLDGFDSSAFARGGLKALVALLKPKTISELGPELGLSYAQANQIVKRLSQFLTKNSENRYHVSEKLPLLSAFLRQSESVLSQGVFWKKNGVALSKIPLGVSAKGSLTGFSRFPEFGVDVQSPVQFVIEPKQELNPEKILVHALKFAQNPNDLALCTIFYLKNKVRLSIPAIEEESRRINIENRWQDMVRWLEDLPPQEPAFFLPKNDFLEKARVYQVSIPQRFGVQTEKNLFNQLDQVLDSKLRIFLIGGNALLEHGLKTTTKDMDIVVLGQKDAHKLEQALKRLGYARSSLVEHQYQQLGTAFILEKPNAPRIDVFVKTICNCLYFSPQMVKRSQALKTNKLEAYYASLEDIFLLKSVSSRDADLSDSELILKAKKLDWKAIQSELEHQRDNLKELNELTILEHLETLEKNLQITIPIKPKVERQALEKSLLLLCQTPKTITEIQNQIRFPTYTIRNSINRLIRQKKIKKNNTKPIQYRTRSRNK